MSPAITSDAFGTLKDGRQVKRYTLTNKNQVTVQVIDFGGIITSILVPDKNGKVEDIVTGFDKLADYETNPAYFGALIGRVTNRVGKGRFTLDGKQFSVTVNEAPNHLHGGTVGFDKRLWSSHVDGTRLHLSYVSADGEEGYPGTLKVEVTYELTDDGELSMTYSATTDKPTIVNMTNHAYFNLAGHKTKSVGDHILTVHADKVLEKDATNIPTGVLTNVEGTLFDLRKPTKLGDRLMKIPDGKPGYDHCFCITQYRQGVKVVGARLEDPGSGRVLEVLTDQPALTIYSANWFDGSPGGKGGASYAQHGAIALEAQNYTDAINHTNFPSTILRPGETYQQKTSYKFSLIH